MKVLPGVRAGVRAFHLQSERSTIVKRLSFDKRREHRRAASTATKLEDDGPGPLKGVKILDLSRVLAAPLCTQILGDYGASVIKVEDVGRGDDTRYLKVKGEQALFHESSLPMSNYFAVINRNKRSICLDLKQFEGKNILFKLVKNADVVIENMRPGAMARLGIDYDVLAKVNPSIIYASVSGYGPSGPYANRAGYDMIVGSEAGMLHLTGSRSGPPVRPGLGVTDMSTGLFMHGAIVSALYSRLQTGKGQRIDASLFESQIALLTNMAMSWLNLSQEAERWGTQHPSVVPYDCWRCSDGYFVCGAVNDKQFAIICRILKLEQLTHDDRFKTNADRVVNRDELFPLFNKQFAEKSMSEWDSVFEGSGLPYARVNTMQDVFAHPQTHAREMVKEIDFDAAKSGKLKVVGPAVKFSETKTSIRRVPPKLGQHTDEVLGEIGISEQELNALKKQKVVAQHGDGV